MSLEDEFRKCMTKISPISDMTFKELMAITTFETYEKGATFVKTKKRSSKEFMLLDGISKSYVHNLKGESVTISFFLEGKFITPSFNREIEGTSNVNLMAMTNIRLAVMDSAKFEEILIKRNDLKTFGNEVLQDELAQKINKEIGLASLTARERLLNFRKKYHQLENIIPHSDIASYLGITNVTLSRLRKDLKNT
ncbi:Crp/Fnr family transcriptional regulator [Aquimarina rhabdastrellae]